MNDNFYKNTIKIIRIFTRWITRIEIHGIENIPVKTGAVLAINHTSAIDPIIIGQEIAKYRPVRALAKDSLFHKPIIGYFMRNMKHIPVLRNNVKAKDSLIIAKDRLQQGEIIAVYPQGTLSWQYNIA